MLDRFTPRCSRCNRRIRGGFKCTACRAKVCSESCLEKHWKLVHADKIVSARQAELRRRADAQQAEVQRHADQAAKMEAERIEALEDEAAQLQGKLPPSVVKAIIGLLTTCVMMASCCGGCFYVTNLAERQDAQIREADKLYAQGKKAEAVALMMANFDHLRDKRLAIQRIVQHEFESGDLDEGRRWIEKGLALGVAPSAFAPPAARQLAQQLVDGRESQAAKERMAHEAQEARDRKAREEQEARVQKARDEQAARDRQIREQKAALDREAQAKQDAQMKLNRERQEQEQKKQAVEKGLADLASSDRETRLAAVQGVWQLGERAPEAIPDLAQAIVDPDRAIRQSALRSLERLGPKAMAAAVAVAARGLKSDDAAKRLLSIQVLGAIGPEAVDASAGMLPLFKDPKQRPEIVRSFSLIGKVAVPHLLKGLADQDVLVRFGAAQALGKMGPQAREAIPALLDRLRNDKSRTVHDAAEDALKAIRLP